jgi:hypothetical protein
MRRHSLSLLSGSAAGSGSVGGSNTVTADTSRIHSDDEERCDQLFFPATRAATYSRGTSSSLTLSTRTSECVSAFAISAFAPVLQ